MLVLVFNTKFRLAGWPWIYVRNDKPLSPTCSECLTRMVPTRVRLHQPTSKTWDDAETKVRNIEREAYVAKSVLAGT